jgi:hypothetical protein
MIALLASLYCYMETPTGQVVNLQHLCGATQDAIRVDARAQYESVVLSTIADQGWDGREWEVLALGDRYCDQRQAGLSPDEIAAAQADVLLDVRGYLDDEPVTVLAAVATYAPEYLCPEFN